MKYVPPIGSEDPDASYSDGNPGAGIEGSPVPAAAIETPMREIVDVISSADIVPDEETLQLAPAIMKLILARSFFGESSGTGDAQIVEVTPAPAALSHGFVVIWLAAGDNTGDVTLQLNELDAVPYLNNDGAEFKAGQIKEDAPQFAVYDGNLEAFVRLSLDAPARQHGECYLSVAGGDIKLSPWNGTKLIINGIVETIPDAGVTLSSAGAAASTTYYIYAYMDDGDMTLERSATAPAVQAETGVRIKDGDATRTLVGLGRTDGASAWSLKSSWFNARQLEHKTSFSTGRSTSSTSLIELNSEIRNNCLSFADRPIAINVAGSGQFSSFPAFLTTSVYEVNTSTQLEGEQTCNTGTNGVPSSVGFGTSFTPAADGLSTFSIYASTSAGTGTWAGHATSPTSRITITTLTWG